MRDMYNNVLVTAAISPQAKTSTAALTGEIIDRRGFESVTYAVAAGSMASAVTYTASITESDSTGSTTFTTVSSDDLLGSITITSTQDDTAKRIGYIGSKRYTRLKITPSAGSTASAYLGAVAILGHPLDRPTTRCTMALILVSAPAAPSADTDALESLAAHLRTIATAGSTEADEEVAPYLCAAVARLDGPTGLLGRALLDQTWRLELPSFPASITLPLPPYQSLTSITYVDTDGDTQTLTASDYRVFGTDPAIILPPLNEDWPTDVQDDTPNAVKVTFVCGYGDTLSDLPAALWHAIMMDAAHLYEDRESVLVGINAAPIPLGYDTLVSSFRQWSF